MRKNLTPRYALIQFFYMAGYAAIIPYTSFFLLSRGMSNTETGLVIALGSILSLLLQPVIGAVMDSHPRLTSRLILCVYWLISLLLAALLLMLPSSGLLVTGALYCLLICLFNCSLSMTNILGVDSMAASPGMNYGIGKAAGALGYAVFSWAVGLLVVDLPASTMMIVMCITCVIDLVFVFLYPLKAPPAGGENRKKATSGNPLIFLRQYPRFILFLLSMILLYFSHAILNNFTLQILQERGGGSAEVGTATAVAAICETVTVIFFSRYMKKFSLSFLLRVSGIFFVLKNLATLLSGSVFTFYLAQTLQMYAWGLICVGSVYFVNLTIDARDRGKGQSYAGMTLTVATVIGSSIGGRLMDTAGVQTMLLAALGVCALGALLMFPATRSRKA